MAEPSQERKGPGEPAALAGPLTVLESNPRYFTDGTGKVVYLVGSHTWGNFLGDRGTIRQPPAFDFGAYLKFMKSHGYNWMRGWTSEMTHVSLSDDGSENVIAPPYKWKRTGPGRANDGGLKYDLAELDPEYFRRMRSRIIEAGENGIYVSVMLFNGYMFVNDVIPGDGNPFEKGNNINRVDCGGTCPVDARVMPRQAWIYEKNYIHKVVDTVHDLPNAMYEVSNEASSPTSDTWHAKVIAEVKRYEQSTYGSRHPVGYTSAGETGVDAVLYKSAADWVSPQIKGQGQPPPVATGQCPKVTGNGGPANTSSANCKVVIADTDHAFGWPGMQAAGSVGKINWVWESFARGNGVAFMDPYLVLWPERNACTGAPVGGDPNVCSRLDPQWGDIRSALTDVGRYSRKVDLINMTPQDRLAGGGIYVLANNATSPYSYLVFNQRGPARFSLEIKAGLYTYEWFDTRTHKQGGSGTYTATSGKNTFTPPNSDNWVLWLHQ
jgi:hypothetical protein